MTQLFQETVRLNAKLDLHSPLDPAIVASLRENYPVSVLPVERRLEYNAALDHDLAHGNSEPFLALIAGIVKESFQPYWHALGIQAPAADPS